MIRDQEIQRLVNYIKGLGLKISFSNKKSDCSAMWYIDNSGIVIYKATNTTKIDTVLSLIHEAAHALHNIYEKNRQLDSKFEKALTHVDDAEENGLDTEKKQRGILLDNEIAGTAYWHNIYKETNMKFPIWKLESAMEYDVWQYQYFYENARYPNKKVKLKKRKEIREKHRSKYV